MGQRPNLYQRGAEPHVPAPARNKRQRRDSWLGKPTVEFRMAFKQIYLSTLALIVCGTFSAAADDLETNIVNFPIIGSDHYNPDVAVNSANALIAAGREKACAAMEKVAEGKIDVSGNNQNVQDVCCLCRLLFIPKDPSQRLRSPGIGDARLLSYSMNRPEWPDVPFVIVSNMPLCIITGYRLEGMVEPPQEYLAYCESNGTSRTQLFSKPSAVSVSNALNAVFDSAAWTSIPWSSIAHVKNTNAVASDRIIKNWLEKTIRVQAANSDDKVDRK